jgi:hypothetical protein
MSNGWQYCGRLVVLVWNLIIGNRFFTVEDDLSIAFAGLEPVNPARRSL